MRGSRNDMRHVYARCSNLYCLYCSLYCLYCSLYCLYCIPSVVFCIVCIAPLRWLLVIGQLVVNESMTMAVGQWQSMAVACSEWPCPSVSVPQTFFLNFKKKNVSCAQKLFLMNQIGLYCRGRGPGPMADDRVRSG